MENQLATKPHYWSKFQDFLELNYLYNEKLEAIKEEMKNKEGLSDSYAQHLKKKIDDSFTKEEINHLLAELALKECHTIMIVGWEIDK
jgi:hypothetical protein